jgi:cellulose biosynthesis protein BcsQ
MRKKKMTMMEAVVGVDVEMKKEEEERLDLLLDFVLLLLSDRLFQRLPFGVSFLLLPLLIAAAVVVATVDVAPVAVEQVSLLLERIEIHDPLLLLVLFLLRLVLFLLVRLGLLLVDC